MKNKPTFFLNHIVFRFDTLIDAVKCTGLTTELPNSLQTMCLSKASILFVCALKINTVIIPCAKLLLKYFSSDLCSS